MSGGTGRVVYGLITAWHLRKGIVGAGWASYRRLTLVRSRRTAAASEYANAEEEAEVVPSSAVRECINANVVVEQMANQREEDR